MFCQPYQIETKLIHIVLNPFHVALYLTNSQTLGSICTSGMCRNDIEVATKYFALNARYLLLCYPRSTFYQIINANATLARLMTIANFRYCLKI